MILGITTMPFAVCARQGWNHATPSGKDIPRSGGRANLSPAHLSLLASLPLEIIFAGPGWHAGHAVDARRPWAAF